MFRLYQVSYKSRFDGSKVQIVVGNDAVFEKKYPYQVPTNAIGATFFEDGSIESVIWLKRFSDKPEDISVLIHELIHHSVHILKSTGITDFDEALAYKVSEIFEAVYDKLLRKSRK